MKVVKKKTGERARVRWVVWNERLQIAGAASLLTAGLGIVNLIDPFVWASAVLGAMAIITTREHNRRLFVQLKEERQENYEIVAATGRFHMAVMGSLSKLTTSCHTIEQAAQALSGEMPDVPKSTEGSVQ